SRTCAPNAIGSLPEVELRSDLAWVDLPLAMSRPRLPPAITPDPGVKNPSTSQPWKENRFPKPLPGNAAPFPTPAQSEALTQFFRSRFPEINQDVYSDQIIASALATPSEQKNFHRRLLEA